MTRDERRQQMDPEVMEAIRSRLVQIKIALTAKRVKELEERVNIVEQAYLIQRHPPKEGEKA